MIDLERTLEVTEHKTCYSRGGRVPEGLGFFSLRPIVMHGCQREHSPTDLTLLQNWTSPGNLPCCQDEGLISRNRCKAFGMDFLLVYIASLATRSHTACTCQIPGQFYLVDYSGFISFGHAFRYDIPCAWKAPSTQTNKLSSSEAFNISPL